MYDDINDNATGGTVLPDFQNFRNLLFQQWEELNNATVELRSCKKNMLKVYMRNFIKCYIRFYGQINDKSKLANLDKKERYYLTYFYKNTSKININSAIKINEITRKLMVEYGVFDLEKYMEEDAIW